MTQTDSALRQDFRTAKELVDDCARLVQRVELLVRHDVDPKMMSFMLTLPKELVKGDLALLSRYGS